MGTHGNYPILFGNDPVQKYDENSGRGDRTPFGIDKTSHSTSSWAGGASSQHPSTVMIEPPPRTATVSQGYGHHDHLSQSDYTTPVSHGPANYHSNSAPEASGLNSHNTRKRRFSYFWILSVIIVCCVVFVVEMFVNDCPKTLNESRSRQSQRSCVMGFLGRFSFQPLRENPLFGPSTKSLQSMGALSSDLVRQDHQYWRLLTCMWLHAGVLHLLFNMYAVYYIGLPLEQEFGLLKVAAIYLLSGFGGSLLSAMFLTNLVSVGASGALFGLVGSSLSELIVNWSRYKNRVSALVSLLVVVALNLVLGLMPYVDNFGHLGGLISGFLLGFVLLLKPHWAWEEQMTAVRLGPEGASLVVRGVQMHSKGQRTARWVAGALFLAGYISAIAVVFSGVDANDSCQWCHYLSCVPTSLWTCPSQDSATGSQVICRVFTNNDGSGSMLCPDQRSNVVSNITSLSTDELKSLCSSLCG